MRGVAGERAGDGDTSYLESGSVGQKEPLGLEELASTPTAIFAVQLATVARKDDAGRRSHSAIQKSVRPPRYRVGSDWGMTR